MRSSVGVLGGGTRVPPPLAHAGSFPLCFPRGLKRSMSPLMSLFCLKIHFVERSVPVPGRLTIDHHKDPLCLKTGASLVGVAGILLQRQNDDWRIITCCSRSTSVAERNYSITDLEGLAVVYCVTKLRNYLLGTHFTILTDHCALCSLKSNMSKSLRLRRWALLSSEFSFSIRYVKGKIHNDVDCFSRAPVDNAEDEFLEGKFLVTRRQRCRI